MEPVAHIFKRGKARQDARPVRITLDVLESVGRVPLTTAAKTLASLPPLSRARAASSASSAGPTGRGTGWRHMQVRRWFQHLIRIVCACATRPHRRSSVSTASNYARRLCSSTRRTSTSATFPMCGRSDARQAHFEVVVFLLEIKSAGGASERAPDSGAAVLPAERDVGAG